MGQGLTNRQGNASSGTVAHPQIARVTQFDNGNDGKGKIKVKFMDLPGQPESDWMRVSPPDGGKDRGFFALPEKDDDVLVVFCKGDQNTPIMVGYAWNDGKMPPVEHKTPPSSNLAKCDGASLSTDTFTDGESGQSKNNRRLWRSRSGHLIMFDDSSSKESVQIWDKGQHDGSKAMCIIFDSSTGRMIISNNNGDTHIRSKGNILIESTNGDIKMRAKNNFELDTTTGHVTIEAKASNVDVTAKTDANLKATATMNVEGTATLNAKGATATYEGTGTATFKGGVTTVQGTASVSVTGATVSIN